MAAARIWIMDGHNMIFAIRRLERLQVSDRRDEARRGLVDRLRRFARARGEMVLVVFDGNDLPSNPDVIREPLFEAVYARRSDGEADDRIIHEARVCLEQGHRVTVVTNDVTTLAGELPEGAQHLEVQAFWLKYIEPVVGQTDKRVEGDFSDVESEMVARVAVAERGPSAAGSTPPGRTGRNPGASPAWGVQGRGAEQHTMVEAIRRKRERGRLRQERRLKRRPKS
jgi:predicted RNA-binding protein with PIN domain